MTTPRHHLTARGVRAAVATGAVLALSGFGAGTATAAAPPPAAAMPQEQTVAWTDTVCGALVPVVENLADPPEFDLGNPTGTQQAYVAYLAQAQAAADRALESISAAGPAPVDDGGAVAEDIRSDLTELRDDLGEARSQLEQTNADDPSALGRSVIAAGNLAGALGNRAQTLSALDGNPRLDAAFEQAQSCERLRAVQTPTS